MSWVAKLRRGEGPVWGRLKNLARAVLTFHIPVAGPLRPVFGLLYRLHEFGRESLSWGLRFFWYEPLFRSQCRSVGSGFRMERLPYISGSGSIFLGDRVYLSGKPQFEFATTRGTKPEIVIGDDSFVGHQCMIFCARSVRIGRHCLMAQGAKIYDMDGHPVDAASRRSGEPMPPEGVAPVSIGDDVWIGTGALILKGVTIGDRAIVGANAVVTKDVPADTIVAGNPARVVRSHTPRENEFAELAKPDRLAQRAEV
jgi:acetyltransferase-like isoleucine patch superfamily enzyme